MNSLRIEKKDVYKIEVNDAGEYIEFDLSDIGLQVKCFQALETVDKLYKELDEKKKAFSLDDELKESEGLELEKRRTFFEYEYLNKMCDAMDIFLGKGACKKIFGNKLYYEMFGDLIEELSRKRDELNGKSHFDMMRLKSGNINERIKNKYKKNEKKVI